MKAWKRIEPTIVQKVGWRTVVTKTFELPDGRIHNFQTINPEHDKSAGVIPLTADNMVIVSRQFRAGPERLLDEIPGGGVDIGEEPQAAAIRELREETSYRPGIIELLGTIRKDAYNNGTWYYYLATNCVLDPAGQELDETEIIEPVLLTIDEFLSNAREGRMTDTDAVFLAYEALKSLRCGAD